MDGELSASLVLKRGTAARVGLERAALLEAIGELGSISAAAARAGLSYKGAWDAVQALNNLFDAPLVEAAPGGRAGGAAVLTPRGRAVIAGFRRVEAEIAATLARLETRLSGAPPNDAEDDLGAFWSLGLKTSARNALRGTVAAVRADTVSGEVELDLGEGVRLTAILTRRSIDDLALAPGRAAIALIKSGFVALDGAGGGNRIPATVLSRDDGAEACEIVLDIGAGKTLVAALPRDTPVRPGQAVTAQIDPASIILAVE